MTSEAARSLNANTDFGSFSHFLHRAELPDEVDLWQPSPHGFKAIAPGAPFFFRLGAPHKAISGYGCFARCGCFVGRAITVPRTHTDQPDPELLDWHAAEALRA